MTAEAWLVIGIVGFSLAGITLIAAVIIFIKLNIPSVIGDLSGKTVAREIRAMRDANASAGDRRFRPSTVNRERGTLTDQVRFHPADGKVIGAAHASKRLDLDRDIRQIAGRVNRSSTVGLMDPPAGPPVSAQQAQPEGRPIGTATEVLSDRVLSADEGGTELLSDSVTDLLGNSKASALLQDDSVATEVLTTEEGTQVLNGTTLLAQTEELAEVPNTPVPFRIVRDITSIHTEEVIR